MLYARKYWGLEVPIIDENNQVTRYEKVDFNKYRMHQGWKDNIFPPGQEAFVGAVHDYSSRLYRQGKMLQVMVRNIWDTAIVLQPEKYGDKLFHSIVTRAVAAFSGKGSPEDVQLTLQLAARCGVANKGLQKYCDEMVDTYARLGLDCNGFVGNYLCYRDPGFAWNFSTIDAKPRIHGNMLIGDICNKLTTKEVKNVDEMQIPRIYVLGMVDGNGTVVDGGWGPNVGHIMVTQAHHWGYSPLSTGPKEYKGKEYLLYSGVEATPTVGLTDFKYSILNIDKNGIATVWRDKAFGKIPVRIYPVP
jgi:hypothetical protein